MTCIGLKLNRKVPSGFKNELLWGKVTDQTLENCPKIVMR